MTNIVTDVSTLTAIPEKLLEKLSEIYIYSICQNLLESELDETSFSEISDFNIGIGTLYIKHAGDEIKYKFLPSENFQEKVNKVFKDKLNLIDSVLNEKLGQKLLEAYKDLC